MADVSLFDCADQHDGLPETLSVGSCPSIKFDLHEVQQAKSKPQFRPGLGINIGAKI